jgi:hypothetical protein
VQKEGWEMFNTLCARMVALADEAPRGWMAQPLESIP